MDSEKLFGRREFLRLSAGAAGGVALTASGPAAARSPGKVPYLILHQQPGVDPTTTPRYIRKHVRYIETLPFDGMSIYTPPSWFLMQGKAIPHQKMREALAPIRGIFRRFRRNFVMAFINDPGDVFDDAAWEITASNWRNLARAAREAGLRGIFFDNEEYDKRWLNYPEDYDAPSRSLAEYRDQTRLRGRQIIQAVLGAFPGIEIVFFHGPYVSEPKTPDYVTQNQVGPWTVQELDGPFFAGFVEGAAGRAKLIDGGEVYQYRTAEDFSRSYRWRKYGIASEETDCAFIPSGLRQQWPQRVDLSFGVYNLSWKREMNPRIARPTLIRALNRCDGYAWFYAEEDLWPAPGKVSRGWIQAVRATRNAVRKTE